MTEPSRASSLATAIDRVEEPMALTELRQKTQQDGAVNPTEASLEVTVSADTSASPEQILAAARDFSAHRAQIWPNVEAKRLDVQARGDTWAEVTEGTMVLGVFWERCHYDWSEPGQITATVIESTSSSRPPVGSFKPVHASDGGTIVTTTVLRDYRHGFKGTFVRSALAVIEKTADADAPINPQTATP
jgi:hypothetical protein